MATLGSDNEFPKVLLTNAGDSSTPAAGLGKLYVDGSKLLHYIDDAGVDVALGTSYLADPMTTRGDVIYRNAANATARLGRGAAATVLTSDGTDIAWASPASGFADPMTTRGDLIARNASNVTARLAIGAAGRYLGSDGTDVSYIAPPAFAAYKRTSASYSTTSATMASVDGTNLALTITTLARRVLIGVVCTLYHSTTSSISLDVDIDGTLQGAPVSAGQGGLVVYRNSTAVREGDGSFTFMSNVLSAASHTFTLKWCTTSATANMYGATGPAAYMQFWVAETLHTT